MWYFGSLFITITMVLGFAIVGRRICDLLPYRLRPCARLYFSPVFGLALFCLIATVHGWLAPFKQWICLATTIPIVGTSFYFEPRKRDLSGYFFVIFVFSIIASSTVFSPLLRFDAYNPFNDTFTYLVHGQWLQSHPFSELFNVSGFHAALTQVALYQSAGHRMTASFFLGWIQGLFGLDWSYYIYPAAVSLPLITGSLAVGGIINIIFRRSRIIALLTALAAATTLNGFTFGAVYGFFPQTFGLAFATVSLILVGALTAQLPHIKTISSLFFYSLPASICLAAFTFTYNDLMIICVVALLGYLSVVAIMKLVEIKKLFLFLVVISMQVIVMINCEAIRIIRNLIHTVFGVIAGRAAIGWPVLWSPIEFASHAFGLKSPINGVWLFGFKYFSIIMFFVYCLVIFFFLFAYLRKKSVLYFLPFLSIITVFAGAFVYFRLFSESPSPSEVGQTFLQFKIAKWASPFCIGLLGLALCFLAKKYRLFKRIIPIFLCVLIINSLIINYLTSSDFTNHFLSETGYSRSSFSSLLHLRALVKDIDPEQAIYLNLGTVHHKLRQMVAYVLSDRKTIANYTDDGYILGKLPPDQRSIAFDRADWVIDYVQADDKAAKNYPRAGNLILKKRPESLINQVSINGGYGREMDGADWWYWTSHSLEFKYKVLGDLNKIRLKFLYLPAITGCDLKITVKSKKEITFSVPMKSGWHEYLSQPIEIDDSEITITFFSDGEPIRISERDGRMMAFLVKNLQLMGEQAEPFNLISINGGYDRESDGKDWWYWTANSLIFKYEKDESVKQFRVKFTYLPAITKTDLKIVITGKNATLLSIPLEPGWHDYVSPLITAEGKDLTITFITNGTPVCLSKQDPRLLSFLVKNLELDMGNKGYKK